MIYSSMIKLAMSIAYEAHKNQVDKGGLPYIFHPFYLATQMDTEETIIVALLHDVVEDSSITLSELQQYGFSNVIIDALRLLAHKETVPYLDYIQEIKTNEIARKVKLADLKHNSDTSRLGTVDDKVVERIEKYTKAIQLLEDNIRNIPDTELTRDQPISLDSNMLFFLSIFRNKNGDIEKYSIDVEKASDSHYELSNASMKRLECYLMHKFQKKDLIDGLKEFIRTNNELDLINLLDSLEIDYTPYHFDDYS